VNCPVADDADWAETTRMRIDRCC